MICLLGVDWQTPSQPKTPMRFGTPLSKFDEHVLEDATEFRKPCVGPSILYVYLFIQIFFCQQIMPIF